MAGVIGFEFLQYFLGAFDDALGKAGQACHLYAIAAVGRSLNDLAHKDNFIIPFLDRYAIVADAWELLLELCKLVVVRGK